jgi:hypothetical protein
MVCKQRNDQNQWNRYTQQIQNDRPHEWFGLLDLSRVSGVYGQYMIALAAADGGGEAGAEGSEQQRNE